MVVISTSRISTRAVLMIYILFEVLHPSRSHHASPYRCSYACEYGYTCQYIYTVVGAYTPVCVPIQTDPVKLWTDETQIDLSTTTVTPTFRPTVRRTEWFARRISSALNAIYRGERPRSVRNITESESDVPSNGIGVGTTRTVRLPP